MFVNELSLEPRIQEITGLEALKQKGANGTPKAIRNQDILDLVKGIINTTIDRSTVLYGIRVLSRFEEPLYKLMELADAYNERITTLARPGGLFYKRDLPLIDSFNVEYRLGTIYEIPLGDKHGVTP